MAWAVPQYSRDEVDAAGARFIDSSSSPTERRAALAVINNWRAAHSFPLNTFQMNLRTRARKVDGDPLIARRLKRLPSVQAKLVRLGRLKLSEIQDMGGCRAIVSDASQVGEVVERHHRSRSKHVLVKTDDYLAKPRKTGYRSVHLIYSYRSDEAPQYNGLLVEVQIRSRLQHAWATAVETVGTFRGEPLKAGQGDDDWLRFFALMSSEVAAREGQPGVPGTPDDPRELREELVDLVDRLDVIERLNAYRRTMSVAGDQRFATNPHTFVLELDAEESRLTVTPFVRRQLGRAQEYYAEAEQQAADNPRYDVVLVAADDLKKLRTAYPNYFADTTQFVRLVGSVIDS